jgi:uncharacterized low-complexity protein
MALTLSTKAKIAAVTMTALSAISGAFSANAQQVAVNGTSTASAWPATVAECHAIKDRAKMGQCIVEVGTAVNQRATQASNNEGQCADLIKVGIQTGKYKPEALRDILAGRPARDVGACNILAKLQS